MIQHLFLWLLLPPSILKNPHLSRNRCLLGPGVEEALCWCLRLSPGQGEGHFRAYHGSSHSQNARFPRIHQQDGRPPDSGLGQGCSPASPSRCSSKEQTPGKQPGAHFQFQATSSPAGNSQARPRRFPLWEHLASR